MDNSVIIGPEALPALGELLRRPAISRVFVLADGNTARQCLPLLEPQLPADYKLIEIPAGEEYKTLSSCDTVWCELTEQHADRHAVLVNVGGGVVTDLGGFAAALYKRGIRFVQARPSGPAPWSGWSGPALPTWLLFTAASARLRPAATATRLPGFCPLS